MHYQGRHILLILPPGNLIFISNNQLQLIIDDWIKNQIR